VRGNMRARESWEYRLIAASQCASAVALGRMAVTTWNDGLWYLLPISCIVWLLSGAALNLRAAWEAGR
jgi:hypothetical protein